MHRDEALRTQLADRLARWPHWPLPPGTDPAQPLKAAAVALCVVDEGEGATVDGLARPGGWSALPALILTRRAAGLSGHAGQWALPGGRLDPGETVAQAALRELHEEVGLALPPEAVLGRLDAFVTRSGYAITPVVVWGGAARALRPNPGEVASVHRIRLPELLRPDAPILEPLDGPDAGNPHPVLKMPVGRDWIAAPTAALLYQFREVCLLDRPTRVAHFEQPRFAWR